MSKKKKKSRQLSRLKKTEPVKGGVCAAWGCKNLSATRNAYLCRDHGLEYRIAVKEGRADAWLKSRRLNAN